MTERGEAETSGSGFVAADKQTKDGNRGDSEGEQGPAAGVMDAQVSKGQSHDEALGDHDRGPQAAGRDDKPIDSIAIALKEMQVHGT